MTVKKPQPTSTPEPLADEDLARIVGGTGSTAATSSQVNTSSIMTTKHDTVKNSISNIR